MKYSHKQLLTLLIWCLAQQQISFAQSRIEEVLRRQDPAALRQLQNSYSKIEDLGFDINDLKSGSNLKRDFANVERELNQRSGEMARGIREARDFMKQPKQVETKSPPSGLHVPVYSSGSPSYSYTDIRLPSSNSGGGLPENLAIMTNDPPQSVINWYRAALKRDGWQVREAAAGSAPKYSSSAFSCERANWKASIQVFGRSAGRIYTQVSAVAYQTKNYPQQ